MNVSDEPVGRHTIGCGDPGDSRRRRRQTARTPRKQGSVRKILLLVCATPNSAVSEAAASLSVHPPTGTSVRVVHPENVEAAFAAARDKIGQEVVYLLMDFDPQRGSLVEEAAKLCERYPALAFAETEVGRQAFRNFKQAAIGAHGRLDLITDKRPGDLLRTLRALCKEAGP